MTIYIIRHGKSIANTLNIVNGKQNDPLTKEGINQIRQLKRRIKALKIMPTLFYTTPWLRAQQSAKLLWPDAYWLIEPRLGETDAGDAATLTVEKFNQIYPEFHKSPYNKYPNGESHIDLNTRVISWLQDIRLTLNGSEEIIVVTHAGPISCIWQYIMGINMTKFPAFLQPNASLSTINFSDFSGIQISKNINFKFINFE